MTPDEWAEKITLEIDWPDINTKDVEFIKQAIAAAVEDGIAGERCAIAYRLGEMATEADSAVERAAYMRVAAFIDERCNKSATENCNNKSNRTT